MIALTIVHYNILKVFRIGSLLSIHTLAFHFAAKYITAYNNAQKNKSYSLILINPLLIIKSHYN